MLTEARKYTQVTPFIKASSEKVSQTKYDKHIAHRRHYTRTWCREYLQLEIVHPTKGVDPQITTKGANLPKSIR
jgi:hypothetical protein